MSVIKVHDVEIHAQPGEVVLVNGVRIEVQASGGGKTRPLMISGPKGAKPTKDGRTPHGGDIGTPNSDQAILDYLTEKGATDAQRMLDGLGLDPKDPMRTKTRMRLERLTKRGLVRPVKADRHKGRPRYEVVPVPTP